MNDSNRLPSGGNVGGVLQAQTQVAWEQLLGHRLFGREFRKIGYWALPYPFSKPVKIIDIS